MPGPELIRRKVSLSDAERLAVLPTGALAANLPRTYSINNCVLTSGTLQLFPFYLPAGLTFSNITMVSGTTAAVTPTHQFFAVFHPTTRALLRQTADDTTTAWAASTAKTLALTSAYTTTFTGIHLFGVCVVAATPPNVSGLASQYPLGQLAPAIFGTSTSGIATGTAPDPAAAIGGTANGVPYAQIS